MWNNWYICLKYPINYPTKATKTPRQLSANNVQRTVKLLTVQRLCQVMLKLIKTKLLEIVKSCIVYTVVYTVLKFTELSINQLRRLPSD